MENNYYPYSINALKQNNYKPNSNIEKYNQNQKILKENDNNINNNINNNVFNVNSYQINSSPKIYKYSFKNSIDNSPYNSKRADLHRQKMNRNYKFIQDNSYNTKNNLNNSLSKHSRMNKSSKYFYPKMKDKYNVKLYNESDYNDSINQKYYNKNRNYSYKKSPSINKVNNNYIKLTNSSYDIKKRYRYKSFYLSYFTILFIFIIITGRYEINCMPYAEFLQRQTQNSRF